jgi:two-component system nitrate/nitrite response regulator NarL
MAAARSSPQRHLFISERGALAQRWVEAFANASATPSDAVKVPGTRAKPSLIWLRLQPGQAVARQLLMLPVTAARIPLVVLSDTPTDDEALEALQAGARGYCNTHAAPLLLQRVAEVVLQGGLWVGESLLQRLLDGVAQWKEQQQHASGAGPAVPLPRGVLTPRELEVATLLARGLRRVEIAASLGLTERNVGLRANSAMDKLQVRDRLQLALALGRPAAGQRRMAAVRSV